MPVAATVPLRATGTLTSTGVFTDTQTVIVGGKTYTFQTSLTDTDGNVLIGADAAASHQNLLDAINLTGTAGTQYAASMTINAEVRCTAVTATTNVVVAKTAGSVGNLIASTETQTNASWGAALLAAGAGNTEDYIVSLLDLSQVNADLQLHLKKLTIADD